MNTRNVTLILVLATSMLVGCGNAPASTASSPSPAISPIPSPSASPAPAATLYVLGPEHGSKVSGTVEVDASSDHVTLTAILAGLQPGRVYLVDADPLPCVLFVDGPSQAFAKFFKADASGKATVVWNVPNEMAANVSVQGLTSTGTFTVLACTDLSS